MKEEEVEEEPAAPVKKREVAAQVAVQGEDDGFSSVGKGGKTVISVTSENLLTRLREVLESRGKKVKEIQRKKATIESLMIYEIKLIHFVCRRIPNVMSKSLFWNPY